MATKTVEIKRIEAGQRELLVWLSGIAQPLELPWFWVRDHSQDPESMDPVTRQRTVDSFAIDRDIHPDRSELRDGVIEVRWPDGGLSVLSSDLLSEAVAVSDIGSPTAVATEHRLWHSADDLANRSGGSAIGHEPVTYEEVMGSDGALARWVGAIAQNGFGLLSGAPADVAGTEALANRVGYVRRTIFGDVWTVSTEVVDHADSSYSTAYLEPHTDGTYSHDGPGLQLFACVSRAGTGGDSVLLDGFAAAEQLRVEQPEAYELLTTVNVPAHYIEHGVELRALRPTIRLAPNRSVEQVSFNNYDRSAFILPADKLRDWYDAYDALHRLIIDESRWWTYRLEPGDTLLFDNWRCLHGRLAYRGQRKFYGCYLNHEDLESRLRVMN